MDKRIFLLAAASFATGTEAYVYAGHLDSLAADLGQPMATAGQLATAFAVTYALTAPVIAGVAGRYGRRPVMVTGLALIGFLNLLAALAPSFGALIVLRVACGLAAGLVGPISTLAAAELAPPEQRGRAMAIVLAGITLAFVLGIPAGSVIGDLAGWRGTFAYAGALALAAAALIRAGFPALPGGTPLWIGAFRSALKADIAVPLLLTMAGFAATFSAVAFVGPLVTAISGLTGSGIGAMQALIGVGSILGIVLGGRMADRPGTSGWLVGSFLVSALTLSAYSLLIGSVLSPALTLTALSLAMIAGAAALFSRTPVIQTRLVAATPAEARAVVLALNSSMVFFGQGLGAAVGGLAIETAGLPALGFTAAALALAAVPLALRGRERTLPFPAE